MKALSCAGRRTRKEMLLNTVLSNTLLQRHRLPLRIQPQKGDLTPQPGHPNHQPKWPSRPLSSQEARAPYSHPAHTTY